MRLAHLAAAALVLSTTFIASRTVAADQPRLATTLATALAEAGANRAEIERAIAGAPAEQKSSMEWLVAHMPAADLTKLDAKFLLAHVDGAYKAWKSAPWTAMVDEETFRDAILPYANISEARELWLPVLRDKCAPMVAGAKNPAEAAVMLNQKLFPDVKVKYSTKRKRADQSPSESMASGLASCSGLSILLVDACRSVGVPARFVGVPLWTDGSGNHSWVEVWDGARWHFTGAAEPSGDKLDEGWFGGRASGQNRDKPEYAIYAVSWRDTGIVFPMSFDDSRPQARAIDVTDRYAGKAAVIPAGSRVLRVCVRDGSTGQRVARTVEVRDALDKPIASGQTKDERFDLNDHLELVVPNGSWASFLVDGERATEVSFVSKNGEVSLAIVTAPAKKHATASAPISSPGAVRGDAFAAEIADENDMSEVLDPIDFPVEGFASRRDPVAPSEEDRRVSKPADNTASPAIGEMHKFLGAGNSVADCAKQPFANAPLAKADAEQALAQLRTSYADEIRKSAKAEFESKVLTAGDAKMPFWYAVYGDKPEGGRSMFISMHGGGGAPKEVNDQQWDNQKKLYKPAEGVYVAPRAPSDTWNLWHQGHIDPLFAKLIRDMIVFENVDPNRVYIMGYSAGGDGVYQLAPRMADSFAAAAMMAGHPNETKPDGLRNIPFTLHMGGEDKAFNRNAIGRQWKTMLADMAAKDPGGYINEVVIHEGKGHWMDREDAVAVPWMAKFTRNLRPTKIVWLQDDVTEPRFYWLSNPNPKGGQRIVASRDGQTITLTEVGDCEELAIRLDDSMVDLDKPVKVVLDAHAQANAHADAKDRVLFEGLAARRIAVLATTLAERGDPTGAFAAEIRVKIAEPAVK